MKNILTAIIVLVYVSFLSSQPNCNVFLYNGDSLQYKACKHSSEFNKYYQFDMDGLAVLDSCLSICPYYSYALYEYGVVYLKAGNFLGWNKYINKAVKYNPKDYLGLRASCRGKFFADYQGAINDIDSLHTLVEYDIGYVHDGAYHLDSYKALCIKALGKYGRAIELFEKHVDKNLQNIGLFDYLHLGVAYQKNQNHIKAIESFSIQEGINDLAENNYYKALSYLAIRDLNNYSKYIKKAEQQLEKGQKMEDGYHIMEDEIFMSDIEILKASADNIR